MFIWDSLFTKSITIACRFFFRFHIFTNAELLSLICCMYICFRVLMNVKLVSIVCCFLLLLFSYHARVRVRVRGLWCLTPLSTIFSYIVALSFIGGENWGTWRKPPNCRKSLSHNVVSSAPCHERDSNSQHILKYKVVKSEDILQ